MSDLELETKPESPKFDFSAFPEDTLFYDRRSGVERRERDALAAAASAAAAAEAEAAAPKPAAAFPQRRAKKERRRRVDPTTFEKQYSDDEMEFMNAMQQYKNRSGKSFPSYGDVLRVASGLGYRKSYLIDEEEGSDEGLTRELESCVPL